MIFKLVFLIPSLLAITLALQNSLSLMLLYVCGGSLYANCGLFDRGH